MARTTEAKVRDVISTTLTSTQVVQFINDASLWVTEELDDEDLSVDRLEVIERYLACALIRLRDLGLKNASINDVSEQYQVDADVTDYLLRAAGFDPSGTVRQHFLPPDASAAKRVKFQVGEGFADAAAEDE